MSHNKWERIYKVYNGFRSDTIDPPVLEFIDLLLQRTCESILDIGCGCGRNVVAIADSGLRVVGVDWSSTAIAEATSRLSNCRHPDNVTLRVGDWRELAGWFGGVLAWHVLGHGASDEVIESLRVTADLIEAGGVALLNVPCVDDVRVDQASVSDGLAEFVVREGPEVGILHTAFTSKYLACELREVGLTVLTSGSHKSPQTGHCHLHAMVER